MSWRTRRQERAENERAARAAAVYARAEEMQTSEMMALTDTRYTTDDILVCISCGTLLLRGGEDKHISRHAQQAAYQPIMYGGPFRSLR